MKKITAIVALNAAIGSTIAVQSQQLPGNCLGSGIENKITDFSAFYKYGNKDSIQLKEAYLTKSRNQRKAGWIMGGTGIALMITGGVIFMQNFDLLSNKNEDKASTGGSIFLGGLGVSLGSVPFFISASRNARKAAAISFNSVPVQVQQQNNFTVKKQPSVVLTVTF